MSTQEYHWKNMDECSGGVPTLSRTLVQECANPVDAKSPGLFPLCRNHLTAFTEEITAPLVARIAELENNAKRTREEVEEELAEERMKRLSAVRDRVDADRTARSRVYFMRNGDHIKIGYTTTSPETRLASIRKAGGVLMPDGMDFRKTELVGHVEGGRRLESQLHRKFVHLRVAGEWFEAAQELTDYIDRLTP